MSERNTLPPYYITLFLAVERAIGAIDRMNFGEAKELLIQGQQQAEELFLQIGDIVKNK